MEEMEFRGKVVKLLERINDRLASLENSLKTLTMSGQAPTESKVPLDVDALLSLPDHLRRTAMAVSAKGSATADEVSKETERTRAAESDYLNQLVKMRYLHKKREGRTVYFYA